MPLTGATDAGSNAASELRDRMPNMAAETARVGGQPRIRSHDSLDYACRPNPDNAAERAA